MFQKSAHDSPWFELLKFVNGSSRLFIFPFAGGGPTSFNGWADWFGPDIDVYILHLPGRGKRFCDPVVTNMDDLMKSIIPEFLRFQDKPYTVFGHSMGAHIGYELLSRIPSRKNLRRFIVAGKPAPHIPMKKAGVHKLDFDAFRERLIEYGATPPEILQDKELLEAFEPALRADFTLSETYICSRQRYAVLECPIWAIGGAEDDDVMASELEAWSTYTTNKFTVNILPGGHFFIFEQAFKTLFTSLINPWIPVSEVHR